MAKTEALPLTASDTVAVVNEDPRDSTKAPDPEAGAKKSADEQLVAWVLERTEKWKTHRDANYSAAWDTYERLWRAIYSEEEKTRKSERSKIISPALSEAVENAASEIEEAVFGRGDFFDLWPEARDNPPEAAVLEKNEILFREDLNKSDFTSVCSESVMFSAVYGTGIGEIVLAKGFERDIQIAVDETGQPTGPTVVEKETERPGLRSVSPRNFIIDPAARTIEEALGVAIEEDVGSHLIREGIENGDYRKIPDPAVEETSGDPTIKPDPQVELPWSQDTVTVLRYYGKVPQELLFPKEKTVDLFPKEKDEAVAPLTGKMIEAWVVIANKATLLKAVETPDMMKDRPVIAYQWDIVPGRFWGRGICEKGAGSAKMLDAELRSRMDALAFCAAPMMAMDATKLPRGFKFDVYPGKNLLLSGDPSTILKPFKFGELDANSAPQVQMLDAMVQRATGSVDGVSLAKSGVGGDARSGAVSMALSGIVKRNKRTLMRYLDKFLGPALRKLMWRYMQYDYPRYTPANLTFNVSSTMGIMQREYETANLTQLLSALQPGTSEQLLVLIGIVNNSGMQNRDSIVASLKQKLEAIQRTEAAGPVDPAAVTDPVVITLQRQDALLELAKKQSEIAKIQAQTRLLNAQAASEAVAPALEAQSIALKGIYKTPEDQINEEFDRRMRMADLAIKEKGIDSRERIADKQIIAARANEPAPQPAPEPKPVPVPTPIPVVVPVGPAPIPGINNAAQVLAG
jgi:hypothetical protein